MPPHIFIIGASGYIGGQVLANLLQKHPEYHVVASTRSEDTSKKITSRYPSVETVHADLNDLHVLSAEAAKANVVLQMASANHAASAEALIKGLSRRKDGPGRYVHVGGTSVLTDISNGYGAASPPTYSDLHQLSELTSLPLTRPHRPVDSTVFQTGTAHSVPTLIIAPPCVYGISTGPIHTRSIQIPSLIAAVIKRGKAFTINQGSNYWDHIHVADLADAVVFLTEEGLRAGGGKADWGAEGYYFCEAGEHTWRGVMGAIAGLLCERGVIGGTAIEELSEVEVETIIPQGAFLYGGNCRSRADRLRGMGWKARRESVWDSLPGAIDVEIQRVGTLGKGGGGKVE